MRRLLLIVGCIWGMLGGLQAQQDAQYTQFMFNKLSLNPGYAVSTDYACISCLHRSQWVGLEGAPSSQSINARVPFLKKKVAFGASINHDAIGPSDSWNFSLIYAYRFPLAKGNLGVGMQGTLRSLRINWNDTEAINSADGMIPVGTTAKTIPNFGVGVYYQDKTYYVGLSVPHLLHDDLSNYNYLFSTSDLNRSERHVFLMGGAVLKLSNSVKFKPSVLFKYVRNTPFDMDLNASFIFYDRFWAGLTYRLGGLHNSVGESLDLVVQFQFSSMIRLGLAYDYSLSKVRKYNSGTYEIMLEYCLDPGQDKLTNPRYF